MKIFITGKTGFIGSHIVEYFERHHDVIAPTHNELDLTDLSVKFPNADACIHAAWTYREDDTDLQIILKLAQTYPRVIILGSGAEYGDRDRWYVKEEEIGLSPQKGNPYVFRKWKIHQATKALPNIVNLRLFGVIGERDIPQRLFHSLITEALAHKTMTVKEPEKIMSWIDVRDVGRIAEQILQNWTRLDYHDFNVCHSEIQSNWSWACFVRELLEDTEIKLISVDPTPKERYHGSNLRYLRQQLYFPKEIQFTPMTETIQRMIAYYKSLRT